MEEAASGIFEVVGGWRPSGNRHLTLESMPTTVRDAVPRGESGALSWRDGRSLFPGSCCPKSVACRAILLPAHPCSPSSSASGSLHDSLPSKSQRVRLDQGASGEGVPSPDHSGNVGDATVTRRKFRAGGWCMPHDRWQACRPRCGYVRHGPARSARRRQKR
jgi:hypothetical protein